jgi:hypothetical protein
VPVMALDREQLILKKEIKKMSNYFLEVITFFTYVYSLIFINITMLRTENYKSRIALINDLILSLLLTILALIIAMSKRDGILQNMDFSITKLRIIYASIVFLVMLIIIIIRLKIGKKEKNAL